MTALKEISNEKLYSPSFILKEIRQMKEYVDREAKMEVTLSEYCGQDIIMYSHTLLAIEVLTLMLLPFIRDYNLAKNEVERFIMDCEWGSYRDNKSKPFYIETKEMTYPISSIVSWIRYINDTYIKENKFKHFLVEENLTDVE